MVVAATNLAKQTLNLKGLRVPCHKHAYLEMMTRDCITGTAMTISDEGEWTGSMTVADPDEDWISDQDFSSTDSSGDVDNSATGRENEDAL